MYLLYKITKHTGIMLKVKKSFYSYVYMFKLCMYDVYAIIINPVTFSRIKINIIINNICITYVENES